MTAKKNDPTEKPEEDEAPRASSRGKAREVPVSEVPMCWVTDEDTPDPYLINASDFDAERHKHYKGS